MAPLTEVQLTVADELVMDEELRPEGVPQPALGGVQPSEEVRLAREPPVENSACIRDFCPAVNMFMQASSV